MDLEGRADLTVLVSTQVFTHSCLPRQAAFGTLSRMLSSWQTYPVHAGVFSRAQAYKADVSLLLQGKADSKDLSRLAALVQAKVLLLLPRVQDKT